MKKTKITAWNMDTSEIIEFEVIVDKIKQCGENGLMIYDTEIRKVFAILNHLRAIIEIEFSLNYSVSLGEFCECHLWTHDGTIDIE